MLDNGDIVSTQLSEVKIHSYSEADAFTRLLLLIATLVNHPGVGAADPTETTNRDNDAMQSVLVQMRQTAHDLGLELPNYSVHTLRKDLKTLRQYGILERRMYRWGYYLGTGALSQTELAVALQALAAQAQDDRTLKQIYDKLEQRLRGLNLELEGQLLYPVRTQLQRSIVYTDPDDMMRRGHYRHTLFHELEPLERAIVEGHSIELYQRSNPYTPEHIGQRLHVYPLQLIYSDIAWYLLYEQVDNGHLVIARMDRLSNHLKLVNSNRRDITVQRQSLQIAHQLLTNGWGLYLGQVEAQQQERRGQLELIKVAVRFFSPVTEFILEGERRHPSQKLRQGRKGDIPYVDYQIMLPERSLKEFMRWVNRFMEAAQVLTPTFLKQHHYQSARSLAQRYQIEQ